MAEKGFRSGKAILDFGKSAMVPVGLLGLVGAILVRKLKLPILPGINSLSKDLHQLVISDCQSGWISVEIVAW